MDDTLFQGAIVQNVELADGRTRRLYYLTPLEIAYEATEIIVLDSDSNEMYRGGVVMGR